MSSVSKIRFSASADTPDSAFVNPTLQERFQNYLELPFLYSLAVTSKILKLNINSSSLLLPDNTCPSV